MGTAEALVLAIIQGLTEFLPVSSSGHLAIGHWLFQLGSDEGLELPLSYVVMVHFGTLIAVVTHYRRDLYEIVRDIVAPRDEETGRATPGWGRRLALLLIIATVPGALGGLFLEGVLDRLIDIPWAVGVALLLTATALLVSERVAAQDRSEKDTTLLDAVLIGLAQMAALIPGISRSGSCIAAGLGRGFDRDWAPRFAFLMSVPVILGGTIYEGAKMLSGGEGADQLGLYALCALVSAVTGYLAVGWVIDWVRAGNLKYFAAYCYVVGLGVIVTASLGLL